LALTLGNEITEDCGSEDATAGVIFFVFSIFTSAFVTVGIFAGGRSEIRGFLGMLIP